MLNLNKKFICSTRAVLVLATYLGIGAQDTRAEENNKKDSTYIDGTPSHIFYNYGQKPIEFFEFTLRDLVDEALGDSLRPDQVVMVEVNGAPEVMTAKELLDKVNRAERRLTEIGKSLRNESNTITMSSLPNPEIWVRQLSRNLNVNLEGLANTYLGGSTDCPKIEISMLGINPATGEPWREQDKIKLPGQGKARVEDLLPKLNNEQRAFCSMGLNLLDKLQPGSVDFVNSLFDQRLDFLSKLNVEKGSALYEVSQWAKSTNLKEIRAQYDELKDTVEKPTPEKLYHLAQKTASVLAPELRLPDIPNIPAPQIKVRKDLELKKRLDWTAPENGTRDIAGTYGNAWAEIRSGKAGQSETSIMNEQAMQGEAKVGIYLIGNQINLLGATLDSGMSPKGAHASMTYCYLDVCTTKSAPAQDFGIKEGDDRLMDKSWNPTYSQQFVVGIVPVVLRLGGIFEARLGWGIGLNLLGVNGTMTGHAEAKAIGEAAVGLKDFVEAGAGGELSIIEDTIKIDGNANVKFLADDQPVLEGSLVGDNTISTLDGRIYAYALIDVLGPIGSLIDKLIDGLKKLGNGDLEDLVNRLGEASELGQKLVNNLSNAGRDISIAWKKGPEVVSEALSNCCKIKWSSAKPILSAGVPYGALTLNGTKARYEQDWVKWQGYKNTVRFFNYKIYIGPDGKKYAGDFASYGADDVNSQLNLDIFNQNISLTQRENTLRTVEAELVQKKTRVLQDIKDFLGEPASVAVLGLKGAVEKGSAKRVSQLSTALTQFGGSL